MGQDDSSMKTPGVDVHAMDRHCASNIYHQMTMTNPGGCGCSRRLNFVRNRVSTNALEGVILVSRLNPL